MHGVLRIAIATIATLGGTWFALRSAMALDAAIDTPYVIGVAFAIGAVLAGAVMARMNVLRGPIDAALAGLFASASAFGFTAATAPEGRNNFTGPLGLLGTLEELAVAAVVIGGVVGGAVVARRFAAQRQHRVVLLLASALLACGAMMQLMIVLGAIYDTDRVAGVFVLAILLVMAGAGFVTQAIAAERRPWTCGSGGLLLLLIFVHELERDHWGAIIGAVVIFVLVGRFGAGIAGRVFARRFAASAPSELPAARVEG